MFSSLNNQRRNGFQTAMLALLGLLVLFSRAWGLGSFEELKLQPATLPQDWKLLEEFSIQEDRIERFEREFSAEIDQILNQILVFQGRMQVRVNYVGCPSIEETAKVYRRMVELVGAQNVLVRKGNVVVEIISEDRQLKKDVVGLLDLSELQRNKLTPADVPKDWRLVKEFFVYGEQLKQFETKFGHRADAMINQLFFVGAGSAQVNYIEWSTEEGAENAYATLMEMVGKVNLVFKMDRIVVEVISGNEQIRNVARRLFSRP